MKIHVKYTPMYSQDGYDYMNFNSYDEFGRWIAQYYKTIDIWEIKEQCEL